MRFAYDSVMTLRPLIAATALLAASAGLATTAAAAVNGPTTEAAPTETSSAGRTGAPTRPSQMQRRTERYRPGVPLKRRVIEAPGAAVMMIPASFEPAMGPFSPL